MGLWRYWLWLGLVTVASGLMLALAFGCRTTGKVCVEWEAELETSLVTASLLEKGG